MPKNPLELPNNIIILHVLLDEVRGLVVHNDFLICIIIDGALKLDVVICLVATFFVLINTFYNAGMESLSIFAFIHKECMVN